MLFIVLLSTPAHGHTNVGREVRTYICATTGYHLEDVQNVKEGILVKVQDCSLEVNETDFSQAIAFSFELKPLEKVLNPLVNNAQ